MVLFCNKYFTKYKNAKKQKKKIQILQKTQKGEHLLGLDHRPSEAQDESDHHHPPHHLHRLLYLVDLDVLTWQPGKYFEFCKTFSIFNIYSLMQKASNHIQMSYCPPLQGV